jgi:hypothetical protein
VAGGASAGRLNVDEGIDFVLHYGDGDHLYFIPHAKDAEDAMRYFFCIEG